MKRMFRFESSCPRVDSGIRTTRVGAVSPRKDATGAYGFSLLLDRVVGVLCVVFSVRLSVLCGEVLKII
jgi:hypothetical protein